MSTARFRTSPAQPLGVLGAAVLVVASPAHAEDKGDIAPVIVASHRLDDAVQRLQFTGSATVSRLDRERLVNGVSGQTGPLSGALTAFRGLQTPSVGALSLRGQRDLVEVRIADVALPDGAAGLSDLVTGRFAESVDLVTGALPARFGPNGSSVLLITPRQPPYEPGGDIEVYGGGEGAFRVGGEASGEVEGTDYFLSADGSIDQRGVDGPTSADRPVHDRSESARLFSFVNWTFDANTRVAFMAGVTKATKQAPTAAGGQPDLGLVAYDTSAYPSERLQNSQVEDLNFADVSWLYSAGRLDLQTSLYYRGARTTFRPDLLGDLLYSGLGQIDSRIDIAVGLQSDAVWRFSPSHDLGAGFTLRTESSQSATRSLVLRLDSSGRVINNKPAFISDYLHVSGHTMGGYLSDTWKLDDWATLDLGARYDVAIRDSHTRAISPRVGLTVALDPTIRVRAGFSHGFNPPPMQRVSRRSISTFYNTTATSFSVRNDPPQPEESDQIDGAFDWEVSPKVHISVDAYRKTAKNLLDEGQFAAPLATVPFNYAKGRSVGGDAQIAWREGPVSAWFGVSVQRVRGERIVSSQYNFSSAVLTYISRHWIDLDGGERADAAAGASWRTEKTVLSAEATYGSGAVASKKTPNDTQLPQRWRIDMSAVRALDLPAPLGAVDIRLDVKNVLDQINELRDGTGLTLGGRQYGPRRQVYLGLLRSF